VSPLAFTSYSPVRGASLTRCRRGVSGTTFSRPFVSRFFLLAQPKKGGLANPIYNRTAIIGGLLLLVNLGAGDFAVEQKKRI
jgi:uncharacterized membrane protein YphA (DoxX/SURF4 family)